LVHDGKVASQGHYYAFIADKKSNIWYRFNDHRVSVEKEEVVFQEAFGGTDKFTSAYGLLYTNLEISNAQAEYSI